MYQKRILPYFIIPSTFSPQASSPLERYRQTNLNTHTLLLFFFPLSARGPTRRRNSTGLAELWGGWPIELVRFVYVSGLKVVAYRDTVEGETYRNIITITKSWTDTILRHVSVQAKDQGIQILPAYAALFSLFKPQDHR